jgi:hypothetical protein
VTISVPGYGVSTDHPLVDGVGTFNYTINQDHDIFSGAFPPGTYQVVVTGSPSAGRAPRRVSATFSVNPPPEDGPPPGAPPPGSPPPGQGARSSTAPSNTPLQ